MDAGEKSNHLKHGIKRKIDTLTLEAVEQQFRKPLNEAAKNLGVSRSTLKRFCRENRISRWPSAPNRVKETAYVTESVPNVMMYTHTPNSETPCSSADWQHSSFDTVSSSGWSENNVSDMGSELSDMDMERTLDIEAIIAYLDSLDSVGASNNHNTTTATPNLNASMKQKTREAGDNSSRLNFGTRPKRHLLLAWEAVQQQFGKTELEAAINLGITTSALARFCRNHGMMTGWPQPKPRKRSAKKSCSEKALQQSSKQHSALEFVSSSSERSEANVSDIESGLSDYEHTPNIQAPSNQQHLVSGSFSSLVSDGTDIF